MAYRYLHLVLVCPDRVDHLILQNQLRMGHISSVRTALWTILLLFFVTSTQAQLWSQLGADIDGEAAGDQSGRSVSLSADGSRLAIGAILNDGNGVDAGHVRLYDWIGSAWVQLGADIDGEAANDGSGFPVSLSADGSRVAIGAMNNSTVGHVRLYDWNGSAWVQLGADIDGEAISDQSGTCALSADGSRVAIGARTNDGNGAAAGHVRLYDWNGSAWVQLGADIDGEAAGDYSGYAVSLSADGSRVAIGAGNNDGNGTYAGHVRLYDWNGSAWGQVGADIDGEAAGDYSGFPVSLSADGSRVAIGAHLNSGNGNVAGHVRLYDWNGSAWVQLGADIDGEAAGDLSGWSVSLSADGSRVVIGASLNAGNGVDAGHVRVYAVSTPVGGVENGFGTGLTVHPNPTSGPISIALGQQYSNLYVEVRDITGKQVATFNFGTAAQTIFEIEGASGIYFIDITSAEGQSARLRIVKN